MPNFNALSGNSKLLVGVLVVACAAPIYGFAQSKSASGSQSSSIGAPSEGSSWASLSPLQQSALSPLAKSWDTLSEGQKRKWIAIAKSYKGLTSTDQEKMHSRMADWAAMSPKDREVARLNFAQTKAVPKSDRAAEWESYQALSPEEKKKLAASGSTKPVGAAVAPKPVPADKLAAVPVTRHTPEDQRNALKASQTPTPKKADLNSSPPVTESTSQPKS